MTVWTSGPRRGPATAGTTCSTDWATEPTSSVSASSFTLTSSRSSAANGSRELASSTATVSELSGWRTRSLLAFLMLSAVEHTSRARSMAATSSASAGSSDGDGQSARCTLRSPVSARWMCSLTRGRNGATTRVVTERTVCRVSMASCSPDQNRLRLRRMYQFVRPSRCSRTAPQAANRS